MYGYYDRYEIIDQFPQGQQVGLISASLNIGNLGRAPTAPG
jgi:hypothetical protein